jgi:prostaglandin-H2 D-isomerase / glutathione transferase
MFHEVVYFNGPGRAEAIRVCLHIAGADWKDTRITDWPALKPTTPLGSMPILKIGSDGDDAEPFTHCQSVALARYAAKLAGMYPDDPLQALYVDEVMETANELASMFPRKGSLSDDDFKAARQDFQKTTMTRVADFLESIIQSNGGGSSVAKGRASVGDLMIHGMVQMIVDTDFFKTYPGIMATSESIAKNESVMSYYESIKKE